MATAVSTAVSEKAHQLASLHESGELVVMPTVWDVWSAQLAAGLGFKALTIGSHPVANALGEPDGEHQNPNHYFAIARAIAAGVDVPVSLDVESGLGLEPSELVAKVLEAGAVGVNIEDVVHSENDRVRTLDEQADYIAAVRKAADEAGVELVINGRTDAMIWGAEGANAVDDPLAEAVARSLAMQKAGARSVYPVALSTPEQVRALTEVLDVPVNVTANPVDGHPAGATLRELKALGVRRVTYGPQWQMALEKPAKEMLKAWL
ncbi:MAG: isocitrate lyase/phosphoenolpyruvate mutase family protein [Actinomycetaceae bacterium]|nr:isocitrate lyase/phosphoenolpyruvate mutase family protein [Arcanobacterium sp.]MDD7687385.1 isocitrate lyase/phosphoenolpyruvate mutase family protein [Actinomycetaceae bacterium]MDY5273536.1 isocitrate lyase/phosphoenolpyruvate mutase family protein [Arcanobacterium sp.]